VKLKQGFQQAQRARATALAPPWAAGHRHAIHQVGSGWKGRGSSRLSNTRGHVVERANGDAAHRPDSAAASKLSCQRRKAAAQGRRWGDAGTGLPQSTQRGGSMGFRPWALSSCRPEPFEATASRAAQLVMSPESFNNHRAPSGWVAIWARRILRRCRNRRQADRVIGFGAPPRWWKIEWWTVLHREWRVDLSLPARWGGCQVQTS